MESTTITSRKLGRPKGSLNKVQKSTYRKRTIYTKDDPPRTMGRPVVYTHQKSVFVNRIIALKYKYKLAFPERDDYVNKDDIELVDILIQMETEIAEIKLKRRIELMETNRSNTDAD